MSTPVNPMDDLDQAKKAYDEILKEQEKEVHDKAVYKEKLAHAASLKGDALAIYLIFALLADMQFDKDSDATTMGHFEDKITQVGDGMTFMSKITNFVSGMENQFSDKSGTVQGLKDFAKEADAFLDATDKDGWMTKSNVIPPETISSARDKILKMRQQIMIKGDDKYNPKPDPKTGKTVYSLTDDTTDKTASHSFGELYINSQKAEGDLGARDATKLFTQSFDGVSTIFNGANSSLKLQLDQLTADDKNFTSFLQSTAQNFFKPIDTTVANSRP